MGLPALCSEPGKGSPSMRKQPETPPQPESETPASPAEPTPAPESKKPEAKAAARRASPLDDEHEIGSLKALDPKLFGYDQARHLLWRAGFGGTEAQIQTLVGWGPVKSVDYVLDFHKVEFEG